MWRWFLKIITPKFISPKMERFLASSGLNSAKSEDFLEKYYVNLNGEEEDAGQR